MVAAGAEAQFTRPVVQCVQGDRLFCQPEPSLGQPGGKLRARRLKVLRLGFSERNAAPATAQLWLLSVLVSFPGCPHQLVQLADLFAFAGDCISVASRTLPRRNSRLIFSTFAGSSFSPIQESPSIFWA